ncbi:hypothetical protein Tco_0209415 [Tanacetum coccineum]
MDEHDSLCWFDDQVSFMPNFESPRRITHPHTSNSSYHHQLTAKPELDQLHYNLPHDHSFLQLPQLVSPKIQHTFQPSNHQLNINLLYGKNSEQDLQVTDWRVLDKFVASQLSNDQDPSDPPPSSAQMAEHMNVLLSDSKSDELASECASISTSSCQVIQLEGMQFELKLLSCEGLFHIGKLRLLDNDGNPLVLTGIVESDSEVEVVFDEIANLRISTSGKDESDKGYGTNSLLEQWRDSYPDNDDYEPYDDDMYENHDMSEHLQSICDDLDITVRGRKNK